MKGGVPVEERENRIIAAYFEKQKPYRIASYKNYWFIRGTITGFVRGGTIGLILDKRNSDVVLLSQEK